MREIRPGVRRLLRLPGRRDPERDADDEIRLHLALRTQQLIAEGMTPHEARAEAEQRFGVVTEERAWFRESNARRDLGDRVRGWMDDVRLDVRYACRTLRRDLAFTAFAVSTIALGLGACVAVFSLVNGLLLRPLPFRDASRLVWISNIADDGVSEWRMQVDHFLDLRARSRTLSGLAGYDAYYSVGGAALSTGTGVQRLTAVPLTCNFLSFLGVAPMLGRSFTADECVDGARSAVLLTEDTWRHRFAADPHIVGRPIILDGAPATVIGVLPASFDFPSMFAPGTPADLFRAFPLSERTNGYGNALAVIGRLAPGVPADRARTELVALGKQLTAEFRRRNSLRPSVVALDARINGAFRPALWTLAGAVLVVMLIVCANLASLQYARSVTRRRELAVRLALGAAGSRLALQAFTESLLIAGAGAALGLGLGVAGTRIIAHLGAFDLPLLSRVTVDGRAVAVAILLCLAVGIAIGVLPALRAPRDAGDSLREGQRGTAGDRRHTRARSALVIAEMAAACTLLVGAGLLLRSFENVLDQRLGYSPAHLATVRIDPATDFPDVPHANLYYGDALRRVRAIPGVTNAAISDILPFAGDRSWSVGAEGQVYERGQKPEVFIRIVSDGYFRTMGIPLLSGRDFTDADGPDAAPVVAVNETLAHTLWPGRDPIGQAIMQGETRVRVIALVGDVRHQQLEHPFTNELYYPMRQAGVSQANLVVRATMPMSELAPAVRSSLLPIAPDLPTNPWRTLQGLVDAVASPRRFVMVLVGGFAGFAVLLAALGIYALVSYGVNQRRREIGIRIALGAPASRVRAGVLRYTLVLAASGIVLGLAAALALGRVLRTVLFGVGPSDPATLGVALVILGGVALAAGYLPAHRAARVDPSIALRDA
ncbi:MAG TPA: ABC transporter permease [Gemmatimonadaceae bacterium]